MLFDSPTFTVIFLFGYSSVNFSWIYRAKSSLVVAGKGKRLTSDLGNTYRLEGVLTSIDLLLSWIWISFACAGMRM